MQQRNIWLSLVGALQKKDKLPVIAFTFSRKRCDENADSLSTLDLLSTSAERSQVHVFFQRSMLRLKGTDSKLPQVCTSCGCSYCACDRHVMPSSDRLDERSPKAWNCCSSQWYSPHPQRSKQTTIHVHLQT